MNSAGRTRWGILASLAVGLVFVWWPAANAALRASQVRADLNANIEQLAEHHRSGVEVGSIDLVAVQEGDGLISEPVCVRLGDLVSEVDCRVNLSESAAEGSVQHFTPYVVSVSFSGQPPSLDLVFDQLRSVPNRIVRSWSLQRRDGSEATLSLEILAIGLPATQIALLESEVGERAPATDAAAAVAHMTTRNPFEPEHRAYRPPQPTPPPAAPLEISILGISLVSGQRVALIEISGQEVEVAEGDETDAGVVSRIDADAVEFIGDQPRRVSLFDDQTGVASD